MSRRRLMMAQQAEKSGTKYPLVNGTHVFDEAILEVTNGNHVKFSMISDVQQTFVNFQNINENASSVKSIGNIRNVSEKFFIKKGDICEFHIKNISRVDGGNGLCSYFSLNVQTSEQMFFNVEYGTSVSEKTVSKTVDTDTSVICMYIMMNQPKNGEILEFDVVFYVNGERYV